MGNTVYQPPQCAIEHLYIDEHLIVLDKPSGLLSVPGRGREKQDSLASRVQVDYPEARIVHRLDMGTSGLMLMALHAQAQSALSRLFQARKVHKRYVALASGQLALSSGQVDLPLITDWPRRPRQKVDHEQGKPSLTYYQLLEYDALNNTSRVELSPVTGRSHQLRVHLSALGHPILGDGLYAPAAVRAAADRLLLHACELHLPHPITDEPLRLQCMADF